MQTANPLPKSPSKTLTKTKNMPYVLPQYCKGCGRCIDSCTKDCITVGTEINPATGVNPIQIDLTNCTSCGLCVTACPEPFGLKMIESGCEGDLQDPAKMFGEKASSAPKPEAIPNQVIALRQAEALVIKGTYASAIGGLLGGCRHVFGYPITPSTEGAELMAKLLPRLDGVFIQAPSETATVNMMYGTSGAGLPCMTFTSSPGFSLMLEGISYMIGAELPGVFVNIMRGGPGLGNIAPEQTDIKLACRGLGHGNTHAIILAPSTPQEMLDLTMLAFELSFKYRNPVVILGDGYLGQMTGKVNLPNKMVKPGLPEWAVWGDAAHRGNLINSFYLSEQDLFDHNKKLNQKYGKMHEAEQRAELFKCEDAEYLIVACNMPAQMAMGAVQVLRKEGIKVGLFRPITVWPFPITKLLGVLPHVKTIVMVEASNGQLEDEMRLALSKAGWQKPLRIESVRTGGGILPQVKDIRDAVSSYAGGRPL